MINLWYLYIGTAAPVKALDLFGFSKYFPISNKFEGRLHSNGALNVEVYNAGH